MVRLSYATLERWLADPERQRRAQEMEERLDAFVGERGEIFVPDLPIAATIPIMREEMWFHGLGPGCYAAMLRRFKQVLEPMVGPHIETWRGRRHSKKLADEMDRYKQSMSATLAARDRQDGITARYLFLPVIFDAFYGHSAIRVIAAEDADGSIYGQISDGTHRLFMAQALGSITTLPAWVAWRTRKLMPAQIAARAAERARYAEDAQIIAVDAAFFDLSSWDALEGL